MTIVDGGGKSSSSHPSSSSSSSGVAAGAVLRDDANSTFPSMCASIGIDPRLRKALSRLGYVRPTLVQSRAIPLAISGGRDLLVRARTGSGKTLAYTLPVLQGVLSHKGLIAERNGGGGGNGSDDDEYDGGVGGGCASVAGIILVPTRELCDQVYRVLDDLIYYCADVVKVISLSSSTIGGGGSTGGGKARKEMLRQGAMLRDNPDVIVSTPAGLVAHVREGNLDLSRNVRTLVVDEADLILSFGEFFSV
jgi:ATP-dependent RNA helicase DDX56/DBP9